MTDIHAYDAPASGAAPEAGFGDYVALLKPRVMSLVVFTAFAIIQAAIVTSIAIVGKGWGPGAVERGAVIGNRSVELFVDIAVTCVAAAMVGLALSAIAKSAEQIMPLLVVAVMSQLVFSGGLIPVTGRVVLDQLSWLTPARWGFASSASTIATVDTGASRPRGDETRVATV